MLFSFSARTPLLAAVALLATLGARAQAPPPEVEVVHAAAANASDWYGSSVDLAGDLLIVGAPRGGNSQGFAHVFERQNGAWAEVGGLYENGLVARQGTTVRILPGPDGGLDGALALSGASGLALVWEEDGGAWQLRYVASPPRSSALATAVGLARDADGAVYAAVAGNLGLDVNRRAPGAAPDAWVEDGCLTDPDGLATTQATLWTGADGKPRVAVKRRDRAEVEVRRRDGGTGEACGGDWVLEAVLTPSALRPTESFAFDVESDAALRVPRTADTDGTPDRVAVAAWESHLGGSNGAAFVYDRAPDGTWSEAHRILAPVPADGGFGRELALSGETLAVAALSTYLYRLDVGGAEAYRFSQVALVGTAMRPPAFAFSGRTVVMGDWLWDEPYGFQAGEVWAFTVPPVVVAGGDAPGLAAAEITVSPNPSRTRATLSVDLDGASTVRAEVVDALGRVVWRTAAPSTGAWRADLDVGGWAPGVYVARVEATGAASSVVFSVVR